MKPPSQVEERELYEWIFFDKLQGRGSIEELCSIAVDTWYPQLNAELRHWIAGKLKADARKVLRRTRSRNGLPKVMSAGDGIYVSRRLMSPTEIARALETYGRQASRSAVLYQELALEAVGRYPDVFDLAKLGADMTRYLSEATDLQLAQHRLAKETA